MAADFTSGWYRQRPLGWKRPAPAWPSAPAVSAAGSIGGGRRHAMSNTQLAGGLVPGSSPGTGARVPAPVAPFAVQSGEGTALETPIGGAVTVKAATRQTNGSLT